MSDLKQDLRDHLEKGLAELKAMGDDIKVRVQKAGVEAKESWKKLEPRLEQAEEQVKQATDVAADKLKDTLAELRTSFENLKEKL